MKKLLLATVAFFVCVAANAMTVYFQNTGNWGTVYVHYWGGSSATDWPGNEVKTTITANGTTYYQAEIPDNSTGVIFDNNDQGQQTKNLTPAQGNTYSFAANNNSGGTPDPIGTITKNADGTYTFTKAGDVVLVPGSLYFPVSTYNYSTAYLYTWEPQITENWPGNQMTKKTINGIDFWEFTTKDNREITNKTIGGVQLNTGNNQHQVQYEGGVTVNPGYYINILTGESGPVENYKEGSTTLPSWYGGYVNFLYQNNEYKDNGVQMNNANNPVATFSNVNIGTGGFKVKFWSNATNDVFYSTGAAINAGVDVVLPEQNKDMTVNGATADSRYNVEFNIETKTLKLTLVGGGGDVTPTYPEQMYVIGTIGKTEAWNPTNVAQMTNDGNGVYTIKNLTIRSSIQTPGFALTEAKGTSDSDWNTVNANRYGPGVNDTKAVEGINKVDGKGDLSWTIDAGVYDMTFNYGEMTLDIVKVGDVQGGGGDETTIPEVVYLRGSFNSWGALAMERESATPNDNGEYVYSVTLESLTGEFKVCETDTEDWQGFNYGAEFEGTEIQAGETIEAFYYGENIICTDLTDVTIIFLYNPNGQSYIMASGENQGGGDETGEIWVNLGGSFNENDFYNGGVQPVENIATFTSQAIGTGNFKIKTWENEETGDIYYVAKDMTAIPTDTWVQYVVDSNNAPANTIEGATETSVYTIEFNVETKQLRATLTSDKADIPEDLYLIGNINGEGWNPKNVIKMNGTVAGVFTLQNVAIDNAGSGDGYFAFCTAIGDIAEDGSWVGMGTRYGAESGDLPIVEGETLGLFVTNDNYSFMAAAATYDMEVKFDENGNGTVRLVAAGSLGVNGIEDDVEAIYFTIDGVKVAHPEKGLYIKVAGGKATKVVVK